MSKYCLITKIQFGNSAGFPVKKGGFSNLILLAFKVPDYPLVIDCKVTVVVLNRDINSACNIYRSPP